MRISGNTVFITGGTSGLGLGLAQRLHEAGNTVIVGGRREALLAEIAEANPGIGTVMLDVADPASIERATAEVVAAHPDLDTVITMAGIMQTEDLLDPASVGTAEATITTNLLGTIRTIAAVLPQLLTRSSATIVTVSSGLAYVPLPLTPTYNATKAAVHSYSESLRVQLADTGVQVIELAPPAVATTLLGQQDDPRAMPVDAFLSEVMTIIEQQPDAEQILVERVKPLRFAVANGTYRQTLAMLAGH